MSVYRGVACVNESAWRPGSTGRANIVYQGLSNAFG